MRKIVLAGAAALVLVPAALNAQTVPGGPESGTAAYTMTDAQRATYSKWREDKRSAYDSWTPELQQFFWGLTPEQQRGWWVLTPAQRGMITQITPENRVKAFDSITAQINANEGIKPAGPAKP